MTEKFTVLYLVSLTDRDVSKFYKYIDVSPKSVLYYLIYPKDYTNINIDTDKRYELDDCLKNFHKVLLSEYHAETPLYFKFWISKLSLFSENIRQLFHILRIIHEKQINTSQVKQYISNNKLDPDVAIKLLDSHISFSEIKEERKEDPINECEDLKRQEELRKIFYQ